MESPDGASAVCLPNNTGLDFLYNTNFHTNFHELFFSALLLLFQVKMASSLGSIPETWPENVLPPIASRKSHFVRKIIARPIPIFVLFRLFVFFRNYIGVRTDFLHEVQFIAGIGPAHFPAAFRMLFSQHSKEGAPFMGTALAEYRQCIGPRLSAIFTLLSMLWSLCSKSHKIK